MYDLPYESMRLTTLTISSGRNTSRRLGHVCDRVCCSSITKCESSYSDIIILAISVNHVGIRRPDLSTILGGGPVIGRVPELFRMGPVIGPLSALF